LVRINETSDERHDIETPTVIGNCTPRLARLKLLATGQTGQDHAGRFDQRQPLVQGLGGAKIGRHERSDGAQRRRDDGKCDQRLDQREAGIIAALVWLN
jgi:hypothetical protein